MSTTVKNCSALIRRSESNFKVALSVLNALSEKYNFDSEEAWNSLCNTSQKKLMKKFRQDRKKMGPYSELKRPRTAFCIYTQEKRSLIAEQNPELTFANLSKKVGECWSSRTPTEDKHYKALEQKDKERYEKEKAAIDVELAKNPPVETTTTTETTESEETTPKTTKKASSKTSTTKTSTTKTSTTKKTASTTKGTKTSTSSGKPSLSVYKKSVLESLKKKHPKLSSKELQTKVSENWTKLSDKQKLKYVATSA